jgi:hypothetical protein
MHRVDDMQYEHPADVHGRVPASDCVAHTVALPATPVLARVGLPEQPVTSLNSILVPVSLDHLVQLLPSHTFILSHLHPSQWH